MGKGTHPIVRAVEIGENPTLSGYGKVDTVGTTDFSRPRLGVNPHPFTGCLYKITNLWVEITQFFRNELNCLVERPGGDVVTYRRKDIIKRKTRQIQDFRF